MMWLDIADLPGCCGACKGIDDIPDAILTSAAEMASAVLYHATNERWPGLITETVRPCPPPCPSPCRCSVHGVKLGRYPIRSIVQVLVDGVDTTAEWKILDNREIFRDGPMPTQDLLKPATEVGTWSATIQWGLAPPPECVTAAQIYTCEIAKWMCGRKCGMPDRVSTSTVDPRDFLENNQTGIQLVDQLICAKAPYGRKARATIYSPDVGRRSHQII